MCHFSRALLTYSAKYAKIKRLITNFKGNTKVENVKNRENVMGTMKIPKLLISMSVPIIISMLVQALYNIVDSIFVARFDNVAGTGALTIAFPIQNLMIAVSVGLAVGTNALLSRSLGQKNFDKANLIAGQGFFLTACGYVIFLIIGLFALPFYVGSQTGADGGLLYDYSIDYLSIICICSFGVFVQVVTEKLLQSTGKSLLSMTIQLSGAIINLILDPIFIFVLDMGVAGAAWATVIGQIGAGVLGVILNIFYNKEIRLILRNFLPKLGVIKEILIIGIPSVLMQAIGSVMTFSMNKILIGFGTDSMNVFGIYFKIQSFVFMPIFGLTSGMVPIVAYNYGAARRKRVYATIKLSALLSVAYMTFGLIIFQAIPGVLLSMFNASAEMLAVGKAALRTISLSFVFAGFGIICSATCQALGRSIYSMLISAVRQLVVLIPAALLLSLIGKVNAVWWAFPIAESVCLVIATCFFLRVLRKSFPKENHSV